MNSLKEKKQFIIHKESGEKLNFFISNQSLYYKVVNDFLTELSEEKLVDNIKYYDIDLDSEDNIHIIYLTTLGGLYYLSNSNNQWEKKILKKFGPQSNSIDFLNIFVHDKTVHIFYSFKNITNNNIYRVIHLYYDNKKWKFSSLESIIQVENTLPYIIDYDNNGDLYFLYKKNKSGICFRIFSNSNRSWKSLGKIKFNIDVEEIKTILVDSLNNFHIVYKSQKDTNEIYHVYKEKNGDLSIPNFICIEEYENLSPKIFEADKKLWIIWKNLDGVHYKYSIDYGISWSEANTIDLQEPNSINFIGSNYRDIGLNKKISTFGFMKDENLYLFGLDNLDIFEDKNIDLEDCDMNLEKEKKPENQYIQQQFNEQINYNHEVHISNGIDNDFEDSDLKLDEENESKKEYTELQSSEQIYNDSDVLENKASVINVSKEKKKALLERIYDFLSGK